ncbi:GNAT family N-acetyltransferase [Antarctobacter heliothermus]|uniref:Protein N-acetyltransferase, RimJ/RimL family n=1 Tax=Antarctobacter heliothermus TaxID=74033 RepID=A0A239I094_9RHOB|nr:GNAT family N-acetyltransferase [Antarctobacter heliothermus]SNS86758.1 Protein N-acetyltransferase, RimJ/RimL family [Antarctobacter heliothermus]
MDGFPDILEQDDLTLRPPTDADLPEITRQLSDQRIARWLATVAQPVDPDQARTLLSHGQHPGEAFRLIERENRVVGALCLGASVWYWLDPEHWREGIMRRALKLAIRSRFAHPAPPLVATCHEDNDASRALLIRLGFAPCPVGRRMFFQGTQAAEPCRDYMLAPEQWHLLHPPEIIAGQVLLRPARQTDAATLGHMLPRAGTGPWPAAEALPTFIETHRFRGRPEALYVIVDDNRRCIGMALSGHDHTALRFLSAEDETRHRARIEASLAAKGRATV